MTIFKAVSEEDSFVIYDVIITFESVISSLHLNRSEPEAEQTHLK